MTTTLTHAQFVQQTTTRLINQARDSLGRTHYERMRAGMHPDCRIAAWDELTERTREAYRVKLDYLMPVICDLVAGLVTQANEHGCDPADLHEH